MYLNFILSKKTKITVRKNLSDLKLLKYKREVGYSFVYKLEFDKSLILNADRRKKETLSLKKEDTERKLTKVVPKVKKTVPIDVVEEKPKKPKNKLPDNIPSIEEFVVFTKSLEIYDKNSPNIDFQIKAKYES